MPRSQSSTPSRELADTASLRAFTARHVDADRAVERHAVIGGAAREVRGIGAGDQRLGRHAAGVDAGAAEQLCARRCATVMPASVSRPASDGPGLAGADDDRVEALVISATADDQHARRRSRRHPRSAPPVGPCRSAAASRAARCRAAKVPITAPTTPAISPPTSDAPPAAPIAAPESAPLTMRAPNCSGTLRLGVDGSWSVTSSTSAASSGSTASSGP